MKKLLILFSVIALLSCEKENVEPKTMSSEPKNHYICNCDSLMFYTIEDNKWSVYLELTEAEMLALNDTAYFVEYKCIKVE